MDAKRPRLFFRNVFELSDPKSPVEEIIKKSIDANIDKMGLIVKNILTTKKREIDERKLAFSAVARENLTLKEGNGFLKIQLDECFKLLEEKDKIMDEGKKKIDEIGKMDKSEDEYKSLLKEFIGVEEQVNDQKNVIELLKQSEDQHETKLYGMEENLNVKNREIKFLEQELRGQIRKKIRYAEKCKKEERAKISAFERLGEMEMFNENVESFTKSIDGFSCEECGVEFHSVKFLNKRMKDMHESPEKAESGPDMLEEKVKQADGQGGAKTAAKPPPLSSGTVLSNQQKEAIMREVLEEHISPTDLAKKHGVSPASIRDWIKKAGHSLPKNYKRNFKQPPGPGGFSRMPELPTAPLPPGQVGVAVGDPPTIDSPPSQEGGSVSTSISSPSGQYQVDENLTEEERKNAWEEFENEKKGMRTNVGMETSQQFGMMLQGMLPQTGDGRALATTINPMQIQAQLRQMNPELTHEELVARTRAAIMQMQNMHRSQAPVMASQNTMNVGQRTTTGYDQSLYQTEMAKAQKILNQQYPGMYRFRGANPHGVGSNPMANIANVTEGERLLARLQNQVRQATGSKPSSGNES